MTKKCTVQKQYSISRIINPAMHRRNLSGSMFERNDVNAVVITTVATNAEYFFMPVYFAPKKM